LAGLPGRTPATLPPDHAAGIADEEFLALARAALEP
jgi:hypothetical protein